MEIQTCRINKFLRNASLFVCLLSCILLFVTSCRNRCVRSDLENFIGSKIIMPDSFCIDTTAHINLIVYYAPENCVSCKIKSLYRWDELLLIADSLPDFNISFIFQTNALQNHDIKSLDYPIILDSVVDFIGLNPAIPADSRYHTFLLDRDNRVVLVGNPLASDTMWSLFRKTLDNMLANDGVYVSE